MSRYDRLGEFSAGYITLGLVRPGYSRFFQVKTDFCGKDMLY